MLSSKVNDSQIKMKASNDFGPSDMDQMPRLTENQELSCALQQSSESALHMLVQLPAVPRGPSGPGSTSCVCLRSDDRHYMKTSLNYPYII